MSEDKLPGGEGGVEEGLEFSLSLWVRGINIVSLDREHLYILSQLNAIFSDVLKFQLK